MLSWTFSHTHPLCLLQITMWEINCNLIRVTNLLTDELMADRSPTAVCGVYVMHWRIRIEGSIMNMV